MKKNKVFVVAAHADDEILGAGGTIANHTRAKDEVCLLILGDGEIVKPKPNIKRRENQARKVAQLLKINHLFLERFPDNQFDSIPLLQIIRKVESYFEKIKPNIVYTHFASDLNIDHRRTFQAVLTACRPQPNYYVKTILSFEVLSSTSWQIHDQANAFCPTQYHDISGSIDLKIKAMKIYRQEIRPHPHPRSIKGIRTLAQYRGMEVGYQYAEAFQVVRNLVD